QNRATAVRRVLVDHHRQFPRHQPEGISDPRVTPLYKKKPMCGWGLPMQWGQSKISRLIQIESDVVALVHSAACNPPSTSAPSSLRLGGVFAAAMASSARRSPLPLR